MQRKWGEMGHVTCPGAGNLSIAAAAAAVVVVVVIVVVTNVREFSSFNSFQFVSSAWSRLQDPVGCFIGTR